VIVDVNFDVNGDGDEAAPTQLHRPLRPHNLSALPRGMPVHLVVEPGPWKGLPSREISRRARSMLALLQLQDSELSIVLTDDDHIHELNKVYRGKDKPTDVLAFAMREGKFSNLAGELLGDVIVSIPTAAARPKSAKSMPSPRSRCWLAHGLLHLLGWDHDTPARDRANEKRNDRLLCRRGPEGRYRRAPQRRERRLHNGGFPRFF